MQKTSRRTHRSKRLCVAAKNLLLVLPVAATASAPPCRVGSVCGAGGSLVTRPASIGATLGRLRSLRTKDGAASPSSSSSSAILTSRRRFGAWLVSAGNASIRDGSTAIGLFPATLASVVGAGQFCSSSLLGIEDIEQHRPPMGPSLQDGPYQVPAIRTPSTGQCLLSAIEQTTSHQPRDYNIHVAVRINKGTHLP